MGVRDWQKDASVVNVVVLLAAVRLPLAIEGYEKIHATCRWLRAACQWDRMERLNRRELSLA